MHKSLKALKKHISKHHPEIETLQVDDFVNTLLDSHIPWADYNNSILFPVGHISLALDKYATDYAANFEHRGKAKGMRGNAYRFADEDLLKIKVQLKEIFPGIKITSKTWFTDWDRTYAYITASSYALSATQVIKRGQGLVGVICQQGVLYVDSRVIAERLTIEHSSLLVLIDKYKDKLQRFGCMQEDEELIITKSKNQLKAKFYVLNEDQAYFLGTLSRNTEQAIEFKSWLVEQFSKARRMIFTQNESLDTEAIIHKELCELSLYTSLRVKSEYPLSVPKYDMTPGNSIKRIDLLVNEQIGIELKKEKIDSSIITDIIGTRGYFHALKRLPKFKYLIISSPADITHGALKLLEVMHPKVIFLHPYRIGELFAQQALKEYPTQSHWWLKNLVFPRFTHILSPQFLSSLSISNTDIPNKLKGSGT